MQRTVVERDDKLENEKLALEKENLRKVMDNFSLSTGLSVVAVNLYGDGFPVRRTIMRKIHSASIFSLLQRAGSGAGGAMKRRAKRRLSG